MSNMGKNIMIFLLMFDILLLIFGYNADLGWFGGAGNTTNNTLGFYINTTAGYEQVVAPTTASTLAVMGLGLLLGIVILGGIVSGKVDIGGAIRIFLAILLGAFTLHAVSVINSIVDAPWEIKAFIGLVLGVSYVISLFEFMSGVDL